MLEVFLSVRHFPHFYMLVFHAEISEVHFALCWTSDPLLVYEAGLNQYAAWRLLFK